jgi:hypothetical protein
VPITNCAGYLTACDLLSWQLARYGHCVGMYFPCPYQGSCARVSHHGVSQKAVISNVGLGLQLTVPLGSLGSSFPDVLAQLGMFFVSKEHNEWRSNYIDQSCKYGNRFTRFTSPLLSYRSPTAVASHNVPVDHSGHHLRLPTPGKPRTIPQSPSAINRNR